MCEIEDLVGAADTEVLLGESAYEPQPIDKTPQGAPGLAEHAGESTRKIWKSAAGNRRDVERLCNLQAPPMRTAWALIIHDAAAIFVTARRSAIRP